MVVSNSIVKSHGEFPVALLSQINNKLISMVKDKSIAEFEIYSQQLKDTWNLIKDGNFNDTKSIVIDVAQGVPNLKGVNLKNAKESKYVCKLTLKDQAEVSKWDPKWLSVYINAKLRKAKIPGKVDELHLEAIVDRFINGSPAEQIDVFRARPQKTITEQSPPASLSIVKSRGEIHFNINKIQAFNNLNADEVMKAISQASRQVEKSSEKNVYSNEKFIRSRVSELMDSPYSLGIGLPIAILGGVTIDKVEDDEAEMLGSEAVGVTSSQDKSLIDDLQSDDGAEKVKTKLQSKDNLFIRVSEDRLYATIVNFDPEIYQAKNYKCSIEWLVEQLERYKISPDAYQPFIEPTLQKMQMAEPLDGVQVAEGTKGYPPEQPYLDEVYKKAKQEAAAKSDEKIDLRDLHQTNIVEEDTFIAEVKYVYKGEPGTDVHGKKVPPPKPEPFKVIVGEGIIEKSPGKFFATEYGVPDVGIDKIVLDKVLVHIGNVNLKSGNIIFDGPVEIRGDIDQGATVEATGDIKIIGNVEAATVRSRKGSVIVDGGVITSRRGRIEAKKDIRATFIENSQVVAGERLLVQKAILNTIAHVGGKVEVSRRGGGMIAGGRITSGKRIYAPNVGYQKGDKTIISCGSDWKTEYSISILEGRLEKLEEDLVKQRADLRELMGQKKTDKHSRQIKHDVKEKIKKLRPIIDLVKHRINVHKAKITYYSNAEIFVTDMLHPNCQILISGKAVSLMMEYREVAITPMKRRGEYIQGLPDYLEYKKLKEERMKISA